MSAGHDIRNGALVAPREYGEAAVLGVRPWDGQRGERADGCRAAGAAPAPAAPSLSKEEQLKQTNENRNREPKAQKIVFCIEENVQRMASEFGVGRLGFLTLTFADQIVDVSVASRRFNSLNTGLLAKRGFGPWVRVWERQGSGAIHYHLIIVVPVDIREGYDVQTQRGSGAGWVWLCRERRVLRKVLPKYSFGRAELVPLKRGAVAAVRYVAKYIAKSLAYRTEADRGAKLVTYSRGFHWLRPEHFSWAAGGSVLWRQKLNRWAFRMGYYSLDEIAHWMGERWCNKCRSDILAQPTSDFWVGPFPQYHRRLIPSLSRGI